MASREQWTGSAKLKEWSTTYFNENFAMDLYNVTELANELISPGFVESLFQNPADWLNTLTVFPFNVVYDGTFSAKKLMIGSFKSDIEVTEVNGYFGWLNMGEVFIPRHFNNFADYNGYTKIDVWLPYYGLINVNPNEVIGKYLTFALSVDYITGQGVYYVGVSDTSVVPITMPIYAGNYFDNCRILSTHSFQLGYQIPLGSSNATQVYRNIISGAVKAMSVAVGAYAVGALGGGVTTSKTTSVKTTSGSFTRSSPKTGRLLKEPGKWSRSETTDTTRTVDTTSHLKAKAINEVFDSSAQALSSMQYGAQTDSVNNPAILCNGSESIQVIIYRPRLEDIDAEYDYLYGKPLGEVRVLSTLTGYTEIGSVHIEGEDFNTATESELAMLNEALLNGVIL